MVSEAVKKRLREQYRALDPVALLAEIRAAQEELGNRIDRRAGGALRETATAKSHAATVVRSPIAHPPYSPEGSAMSSYVVSRVSRIGGLNGVTRSGSECRQSSTHTWR